MSRSGMSTTRSPYDNIVMHNEGTKLIIEIEMEDVAKSPSKSGKSQMIATTGGNIPVPGRQGAKLGLNLYEPVS